MTTSASASTAKDIDGVSAKKKLDGVRVNFTKIKKDCAKSGLCIINILHIYYACKPENSGTVCKLNFFTLIYCFAFLNIIFMQY